MAGVDVGQYVDVHEEEEEEDNAEDDPNTLHMYDLTVNIEQGSFGKVWKCKHKENQETYAIKDVDLRYVKRKNFGYMIARERRAMRSLAGSPFIITLYGSFQDEAHCYFIMEYADNGDLITLIDSHDGLDVKATRFYGAELTLALEWLRARQWVHRDLKAENILLDKNWHLKLADFGCAKRIGDAPAKPGSYKDSTKIGTPQMMAPEVIRQEVTTCSSDLWSLGCCLYEMEMNNSAFGDDYGFQLEIERAVLKGQRNDLDERTDSYLKDLIDRLLVVDINSRLGHNSFDDLRAHPFFMNVNWQSLHLQPVPPFVDDGAPPPPRQMLPLAPPPPMQVYTGDDTEAIYFDGPIRPKTYSIPRSKSTQLRVPPPEVRADRASRVTESPPLPAVTNPACRELRENDAGKLCNWCLGGLCDNSCGK